MKTRYFARYQADINLRLHIPLRDVELHTTVEFVCPFCLRALYNVTMDLQPMLPKPWFDISVNYSILEPEVKITDNIHYSKIFCHNYQHIVWLIMREILYVLSFELSFLKYYYDEQKTKSCK